MWCHQKQSMTDRQVDDGQSDPFVELCFARTTKIPFIHEPPTNIYAITFQKLQCLQIWWHPLLIFKTLSETAEIGQIRCDGLSQMSPPVAKFKCGTRKNFLDPRIITLTGPIDKACIGNFKSKCPSSVIEILSENYKWLENVYR